MRTATLAYAARLKPRAGQTAKGTTMIAHSSCWLAWYFMMDDLLGKQGIATAGRIGT
jgi:hypothetical protein